VMKWYEFPDVRVKVTFQYRKMEASDYDAWVVEEAKYLKLSEVGTLADGVAAYGYDLFEVAWLNLIKVRGSAKPIYTRGFLVRTGERSMGVRMRERKVDVRMMTDEDRARLAVAAEQRASGRRGGGALEQWEMVERDRMGIEWLRCHAADEAYEVDFASREEMDAWRAHAYLMDREES
jgi:hypothetical protein